MNSDTQAVNESEWCRRVWSWELLCSVLLKVGRGERDGGWPRSGLERSLRASPSSNGCNVRHERNGRNERDRGDRAATAGPSSHEILNTVPPCRKQANP